MSLDFGYYISLLYVLQLFTKLHDFILPTNNDLNSLISNASTNEKIATVFIFTMFMLHSVLIFQFLLCKTNVLDG